MVTGNFASTGSLWEKYNVVTGGTDAANEYPMPPMIGWTAAVFVCAVKYLETSRLGCGPE